LTGAVLAKLDSTAKGGVIVGIAGQLGIPVRFVGLGRESKICGNSMRVNS